MAKEYLDKDGLLYLWQKIKSAFLTDVDFNSTTNYITKTKNGTTSNVVQIPSGVSPSTTTPAMDGTAAAGSETAFARGDHVHPTDTSRAASSHAHGNITNAGALQTTDITIANGDKLVVTDSSNSDKVARTSITFDGTTETKALTPKGTWVDFPSTDDHKWNDVALAHTNATTAFGTNVDFAGYIAVIDPKGGTSANPSIDGTSAQLLKMSTMANAASTIAARDGSGYLWATSPASGSNNTTVATTAWVNSAISAKSGAASGLCPLDANSKVDSSYLPSYVDDVIEAYPRTGQTELSSTWLSLTSGGSALTPETGKIYVLMADSTSYAANSQFRYASGTTPTYVKLADGGVTSITNGEIDTIVAS